LKTILNTWYIEKKKNEKIKFFESSEPEHVEGLYKNGKFYTPPGLPADSRPTEMIRKQGETILNNRPLPNPSANRPGPGPGPGRNLPSPGTGRTLPSPGTGRLPTTPPPTTTSLPPTNNVPPPRQNNAPKCKALYNYTAQENDELSLRKGDIITIIKEHPDWWEGEINGVVGVFPANYVTKVDE